MELWEDIDYKQRQLDEALRTYSSNGKKLAEAEADYKIALRKKVLELRESGMAVTLIPLIVYGESEVVKPRMERDICEAVYKANCEAINVKKLEIKIIQDQMEKEWSNTK